MKLTYGSLCSGYEGIGLALHELIDCEPAWFAEFAKGPSKILAYHFPTVPNLGDMTKIDWKAVPPIRIATGGTPCQDLSTAGKRRGMTEGTRSNLWVQMRECIAQQRPTLVVWENVRGAFSARADSEVESEERLLGGGSDGPYLRALGRVLGDLSELGYDAEWVGVRASDFGAPHNRERVYIVAYPASVDGESRHRVESGGSGRASLTAGGLSRLAVHQRRREASKWLAREPGVDRLANGIPHQLDRLRGAGNAVVPQVIEHIGRQIIEHARRTA